jgi:hypothetical protein
MATYAVIYSGIVTNTIVAEPKDIPIESENGIKYVEYTYENPAVIGLQWDGQTFQQPQGPFVSDQEREPAV